MCRRHACCLLLGKLPHMTALQMLVMCDVDATHAVAGGHHCCGRRLAVAEGRYLRPFLPFLPDLAPPEAPAAARLSRSSFSLAACAAAWAFLDRPGCFGTSSATRLYRVFPAVH